MASKIPGQHRLYPGQDESPPKFRRCIVLPCLQVGNPRCARHMGRGIEGLGILSQLPGEPGRDEATGLMRKLRAVLRGVA